jgi:hypothetical protein
MSTKIGTRYRSRNVCQLFRTLCHYYFMSQKFYTRNFNEPWLGRKNNIKTALTPCTLQGPSKYFLYTLL